MIGVLTSCQLSRSTYRLIEIGRVLSIVLLRMNLKQINLEKRSSNNIL